MKIVRVFLQEHGGKQVGDIHDVFPAEQHPGSILSGTLKEVEVEDDFDLSDKHAVIGEDGEVTFEVYAPKVMEKKQARITEKYKEMDAEVMARMAEVFGTNRADSATANYQTLLLMSQSPSIFSDGGLEVDIPAGEFNTPGAALDTPQKVQNYANERLDQISLYGLWRLQRVKQFRDERAAILAE